MIRGATKRNDEVAKLQQHLSLLRDQYSLLQERCSQLQQERDVAQLSSGTASVTASFVSRLIAFISQLHNKEEYSDLKVKVSDSQLLCAHKFVLAARSDHWQSLNHNDVLDWSGFGVGVGEAVLQWVYSGQLQQQHGDDSTSFMMLLMTAAAKLHLPHLLTQCEEVMVARVTVKNCVRLYTTADEIGAATLRDHCSALISAHWDDFTSEDFTHMSAPLLYAMFKSKTRLPLHAAVRHRREDVVFLYLIEYRAELPGVLSLRDADGSPVLEVALQTGQSSVADTLLQHGAPVDDTDAAGATLLHRAVQAGDEFTAQYLLQHGALVNCQDHCTGRTPLHILVSGGSTSPHSTHPLTPPHTPYAIASCYSSSSAAAANNARRGFDALSAEGVVATSPQHNGRDNTSTQDGATATTTLLNNGHHHQHHRHQHHRGNTPSQQPQHRNSNRVSPPHSSSSGSPPSSPLGMAFESTSEASSSSSSFTRSQRISLCQLLLEKGADPNIQDKMRRTVIHSCVMSGDGEVLCLVLQHRPLHLDARDADGNTAMWYALFHGDTAAAGCSTALKEDRSIPALLRQHGADVNEVVAVAGDTLLHEAGWRGAEVAGLFLVEGGASVNALNRAGETPLHCSATTGMPALTAALLKHGADPNVQTVAPISFPFAPHFAASSSDSPPASHDNHSATNLNRGDVTNLHRSSKLSLSESSRSSNGTTSPSTNPFDEPDSPSPHCPVDSGDRVLDVHSSPSAPHHDPQSLPPPLYRETALHRAIGHSNEADVHAILQHAASSIDTAAVNLELRDSLDRTPLTCALTTGLLDVAGALLRAGASVSAIDGRGQSYLHRAVAAGDARAALFLLDQGADPLARNREGLTPLEQCIHGGVADPTLLERLCCDSGGAGGKTGSEGVLVRDPPLWQALVADRMDVAAMLVKHGADPDCWHDNGDGYDHTLLHRAIDENLEAAALFLLSSNCDANAPRRRRRNVDSPPDQLTPLHMCSAWGLHSTALVLAQHGAKVNAKDAEGKTPLHLAIEHGHSRVLDALLAQPSLDLTVRDRQGTSPFAAALQRKNHAAARAILEREPLAAQQLDHKGHNFLHVAVSKRDLESVLFLLSVHVDLSTTTKDDAQLAPLHLAVIAGCELLVRNLLLAGADISALTPQRQTALHLAAERDHSHLGAALLENNVPYDALDADLNNALHVAVKHGHVATARTLLTQSNINATAVNLRGQNPLHVLAAAPHLSAADAAPAIARLFLEAMPDYPIDAPDVHGNTALLLAYQRGNGQLCRVLVCAGASLSASNERGETIFNSAVASRALLAALLDALPAEPPWAEGDNCMECGAKFTLATRRHHCRHCGRLLCGRCSDKLLPILKFTLHKPVRVCHTCSQVLTLGPAALT